MAASHDPEVVFEQERYFPVVGWKPPDTPTEPRWAHGDGACAPPPDELSAWTPLAWDYASASLREYQAPSRAPQLTPTPFSLLRRREWRSSLYGVKRATRGAWGTPSPGAVAALVGLLAQLGERISPDQGALVLAQLGIAAAFDELRTRYPAQRAAIAEAAAVAAAAAAVAPLPASDAHAVVRGVWVPDASSPTCTLCNTAFSVLLHRHHCRECGCLVCSTCSSQCKLLLLHGAHAEVLKVCDACANVPSGVPATPAALSAATNIPLGVRAPLVVLLAQAAKALLTPGARATSNALVAALCVELDVRLDDASAMLHAASFRSFGYDVRTSGAGATANCSSEPSSPKTPVPTSAASTPLAPILRYSLGDSYHARADVLAAVAGVFIARGVWDATAWALLATAARGCGVPLGTLTLAFHMSRTLAAGRKRPGVDGGGGSPTPPDSAPTLAAFTSAPRSALSAAAWAIVPVATAAVAVAATGGALMVPLGAAALFGAGLTLVGGTALSASSIATAVAAGKGYDELSFECLSHEHLMSPRALRMLAASRRSSGAAAVMRSSDLAPAVHTADLSGITILIASGLSFSGTTAPGNAAPLISPEQRLLADFAAPWGGVENADASPAIPSPWDDRSAEVPATPGGSAPPGWWGRAHASPLHSGEVWALCYSWTALSALDSVLNTAAALHDAGGAINQAVVTVVGSISAAMGALQLNSAPWARAMRESEAAGRSLAHALLRGVHGRRPVRLVSYGFGARVAYYCALELGRAAEEVSRATTGSAAKDTRPPTEGGQSVTAATCWPCVPAPPGVLSAGCAPASILSDVILLAPPVEASEADWRTIRSAASGRVAIGFSTTDALLLSLEQRWRLDGGTSCPGVRALDGAVPFAFASEGYAIASITSDGVECWDVSLLAPRHRDFRGAAPGILHLMGFTGAPLCALTEGARAPVSVAPLTNALLGVTELQRLHALLADLTRAATRCLLGVQSPDYAAAFPLVVALKDGASALFKHFPAASAVTHITDEVGRMCEDVRKLALEEFKLLGVTDEHRPLMGGATVTISEEAATTLRAAAEFCDALGTGARDALLAHLFRAQLSPIAAPLSRAPTISPAAAVDALTSWPRRFVWFKSARLALEHRYSAVLFPREWRVDERFGRAFADDCEQGATRLLEALCGRGEPEALLSAQKASVLFEVSELERCTLARAERGGWGDAAGEDAEADAAFVASLQTHRIASLFTEALSPGAEPPSGGSGARGSQRVGGGGLLARFVGGTGGRSRGGTGDPLGTSPRAV